MTAKRLRQGVKEALNINVVGKNSNNNNMAFSRGDPESGNPAMRAKRLRQGVKETHNINVVGKKRKYFSVVIIAFQKKAKIF